MGDEGLGLSGRVLGLQLVNEEIDFDRQLPCQSVIAETLHVSEALGKVANSRRRKSQSGNWSKYRFMFYSAKTTLQRSWHLMAWSRLLSIDSSSFSLSGCTPGQKMRPSCRPISAALERINHQHQNNAKEDGLQLVTQVVDHSMKY